VTPAQAIAAPSHLSGKKLAKTVIVKIDCLLAMVVVPASAQVTSIGRER
jgi:Ala-tRNA(Pro) deacylase